MTEYEKMLGNLPYDYTDEEIQARIVHSHENYDTMRPYIALTDKTRKNMMETNF